MPLHLHKSWKTKAIYFVNALTEGILPRDNLDHAYLNGAADFQLRAYAELKNELDLLPQNPFYKEHIIKKETLEEAIRIIQNLKATDEKR